MLLDIQREGVSQQRPRLGQIEANPHRYASGQCQQRSPPVVGTEDDGHVVRTAPQVDRRARQERIRRQHVSRRPTREAWKGQGPNDQPGRASAGDLGAPRPDQIGQLGLGEGVPQEVDGRSGEQDIAQVVWPQQQHAPGWSIGGCLELRPQQATCGIQQPQPRVRPAQGRGQR
jgi:hypothetical protein